MPEFLKVAMLNPLLKKVNADYETFSNFQPISNVNFLWKLISHFPIEQRTGSIVACLEGQK
jgi:hypothetical protein